MINLASVVFSLVMGFLMSGSITLVTTYVRLGVAENYLDTWLGVWSIAYPVAIICILIYKPFAVRLTDKLVGK